MGFFDIYKRGQGKYTRLATWAGGMVLGGAGAYALSQKIAGYNTGTAGVYLQYGIPAALLIALAILLFWIINRPKSADFMIATEGEMKKVSWSSRKEIIGSTKVVIVTTFILAGLLFGVDMLFLLVFNWLGIVG